MVTSALTACKCKEKNVKKNVAQFNANPLKKKVYILIFISLNLVYSKLSVVRLKFSVEFC